VYRRPLRRTFEGLSIRPLMYEIAAMFAVSGQGLMDVKIPSHIADPIARIYSVNSPLWI